MKLDFLCDVLAVVARSPRCLLPLLSTLFDNPGSGKLIHGTQFFPSHLEALFKFIY